MTKQTPRSEEADTDKPTVARKDPGNSAASDTAEKPRRSIFDESYAPVGAELRKAWYPHSRKS